MATSSVCRFDYKFSRHGELKMLCSHHNQTFFFTSNFFLSKVTKQKIVYWIYIPYTIHDVLLLRYSHFIKEKKMVQFWLSDNTTDVQAFIIYERYVCWRLVYRIERKNVEKAGKELPFSMIRFYINNKLSWYGLSGRSKKLQIAVPPAQCGSYVILHIK